MSILTFRIERYFDSDYFYYSCEYWGGYLSKSQLIPIPENRIEFKKPKSE